MRQHSQPVLDRPMRLQDVQESASGHHRQYVFRLLWIRGIPRRARDWTARRKAWKNQRRL